MNNDCCRQGTAPEAVPFLGIRHRRIPVANNFCDKVFGKPYGTELVLSIVFIESTPLYIEI